MKPLAFAVLCVLASGCFPAPPPMPTPVDAGSTTLVETDAGLPEPDAGEIVVVPPDGGAAPVSAPCTPVRRTPHCTGQGDGAWCWVAPLPLLTSASAIWANDCEAWAAGQDGWFYERRESGWRPTRLAFRTINAFAAFAHDDAWAVGDEGTLLHFDGRSWQHVRHGEQASFLSAYAPARGVVFLGAAEAIYRFEQGAVQRVLSAPRTTFTGLSGDGVTVRAVGSELVPNVDRPAVVWRFDGSRWEKELQRSMVKFNAVVSHQGTWYLAGSMNAHGPDWGYVTTLPPARADGLTQAQGAFSRLAGNARGAIAVVAPVGATPLVTFSAGTFATPRGLPNRAGFSDISAASEDFFVAGSQLGRLSQGGFEVETDAPGPSLTSVLVSGSEVWLSGGLRSRGGGPFQPTAPSSLALEQVVGTPPANLWAIAGGVVQRFDGSSWSPTIGGPRGPIRGLAAAQDGTVWAWSYTELWRFGSGTWQQSSVPWRSFTIADVWTPPTGETLIAGTFDGVPLLVATNGARFAEVSPAPPEPLAMVRGRSATDLFAVTTNGNVLHLERTAWVPTDNGMTGKAQAIAVRGGHVVVSGRQGFVAWWTGMRFVEEPIGSAVWLRAVAIDEGEGEWAVGEGGAVLHKRRGVAGP